jgi:hypothetical protein
MSSEGAVVTSPANIRSTLVGNVAATNPGYTANLPGTLIEDIASTDVAAIAQCDQARVDAINSVTPYGANAFILAQLGAQYGIAQGTTTNTSVYVTFTGTVGYVIQPGFIVSDGTYQYVIQDGGTVGSGGSSSPLYAVANQSGSWAVPAGTVTTVVTSVPGAYTLTVTNASDGTPGGDAETVDSYRSRILQASQVAGTGTASFIKTNVKKVAGVQPRLVSVVSAPGGWEVICGGGDPYEVGGAIYSSILDITSLQGSTTATRNVVVSVIDVPNTYSITYVNPPMQTVKIDVIWNTNLSNFTGSATINQLTATAIQNYVNGVVVGQPLNLLEVDRVFQDSVASIIDSEYISAISYTVKINGVTTSPSAGTSLIYGDSESYFYSGDSDISVVQG